MKKYIIHGGGKLEGILKVHGAKNAALPILAASALIRGESVIHNCPNLSDVDAALSILKSLGCNVSRQGTTVTVNAKDLSSSCISEEMMRTMRSSIIFLPSILSRTGSATVCYPGGCDIGLRPVDLHLLSLRLLGAAVIEDGCEIRCNSDRGLKGTKIVLPFPSVGATECIMIASCIADGVTTIVNGAREPEISDLAEFLNAAGGKIHIGSEGTVVIEGVSALHSVEHIVIPDRIVASTYMCAAAATGSELIIDNIVPSHLGPVLPVFDEMGCKVFVDTNSLRIQSPKRLHSVKEIKTMPYPGFPTDCQAVVAACLATARGTSVIQENIFENRFRYLSELSRFGSDVRFAGKTAIITGVKKLHSANVHCTDLRGGAALVAAALAAEGMSQIMDVSHIERGYENLPAVLSGVGAAVMRIDDEKQEVSKK